MRRAWVVPETVDERTVFRIYSESTLFPGRAVGHATPFHTREMARRVAERHHDLQEGPPDLPVVGPADRAAFVARVQGRPQLQLVSA